MSKAFGVLRLILLIGSLNACTREGQAQPAAQLVLRPEEDSVRAGTVISVLEDPDHSFTPDICRQAGAFFPAGTDVPVFSYSPSAWWLRFELSSTRPLAAAAWTLSVDWHFIDHLNIYYFQNGNPVGAYNTGRLTPLPERPIYHRSLLAPLPALDARPTVVCLRVMSAETLQVPVRLYSARGLLHHERDSFFLFGLYYGILLAVLAYNLFLFVSIREGSFGLYCLYVCGMTAFMLSYNGLAYYLWPNSPNWQQRYTLYAVALVSLSASLFVRQFLETRRRFPRLDRAWKIMIGIVLVQALAAVAQVPYALVAPAQVTTSLGLVVMSLLSGGLSLRVGFRPARWFLIAWIMPLAGILLLALQNLGFIPASWFTDNGAQVGTGIEAVLLSIALGDRVNGLKTELRELNERLERTVVERTTRLNEALVHLSRRSVALDNELALARSIQDWILAPPHYAGEKAEIHVYCEFLHAVGGDFYEYLNFPGGELGLVVADAAGHGIPAGFLTALAKVSFAEAARRAGPSPRSILLEVNAEMNRLIKTHEYLTASILIFSSGRLRYSSAGHTPAHFLRRATGTVSSLDTDGTLIGIFPSDDRIVQSLGETTVEVAPGDRLLLSTDGASDVQSPHGESLGEERLAEFLRDTAHLPLSAAHETILAAWTAFHEGGKREDDVTIVLVEIR